MNVIDEPRRLAIIILHGAGASLRQIVRKTGSAKNTVALNLKKVDPMETRFTCLKLYRCLKCGHRVEVEQEYTAAGNIVSFQCSRCGWRCPEYINLTTRQIEGGDRTIREYTTPPQTGRKLPEPINNRPTCKCGRSIYMDGMCRKCYKQHHNVLKGESAVGNKKCSVSECTSGSVKEGLCYKHYKQKHGRPPFETEKKQPDPTKAISTKSLLDIMEYTAPAAEPTPGIFIDFSEHQELLDKVRAVTDDVQRDIIQLLDDVFNGRVCRVKCSTPECREPMYLHGFCARCLGKKHSEKEPT